MLWQGTHFCGVTLTHALLCNYTANFATSFNLYDSFHEMGKEGKKIEHVLIWSAIPSSGIRTCPPIPLLLGVKMFLGGYGLFKTAKPSPTVFF